MRFHGPWVDILCYALWVVTIVYAIDVLRSKGALSRMLVLLSLSLGVGLWMFSRKEYLGVFTESILISHTEAMTIAVPPAENRYLSIALMCAPPVVQQYAPSDPVASIVDPDTGTQAAYTWSDFGPSRVPGFWQYSQASAERPFSGRQARITIHRQRPDHPNESLASERRLIVVAEEDAEPWLIRRITFWIRHYVGLAYCVGAALLAIAHLVGVRQYFLHKDPDDHHQRGHTQ